MRIRFLNFILGAGLLAALVEPVCAANLVTLSPTGQLSLGAGGNSFGPVFNANGQRLAFVSHAGNLVTNQTDPNTLQVYVRSLVTDRTTLVSVNTNGRGANASATGPVITPGGQFIAFTSEATDLTAGDTNNACDVYLRDLASGTTRLISVTLFGRAPDNVATAPAATQSGNPFLSADGRWVFFESYSSATNFTTFDDTNATVDIFARDTLSNRTVLVSQSFLGPQTAERSSRLWGVSADGSRAVFISRANDLVPGVTNWEDDKVYVRDLNSNVTFYAGLPTTNFYQGYYVGNPALSADGRFVAFTVGNYPVQLYLRDLEAAAPVLVATYAPSYLFLELIPQISADGRYLLHEDGSNVFRFDRISGTNQLVSVALSGGLPAAGISRRPVMTPDGNGMVFVSSATDLTTNGGGGFQIYARDMAAGVTRLVSVASNGQPSSVEHELSSISLADFLVVAFDSPAADLVAGDGNRASDVFIRDVAGEATHLVSRREATLPRLSGVAHSFVGDNSLSADGRFVAFTSFDNDLLPGDTNGRPDIFVRDLLTGTVVTPGFSTNAVRFPSISADGRYVVYLRRSPTNSADTTGGAVWRLNIQTGVNELITGSSSSRRPAISGDGSAVAYLVGSNLVIAELVAGTNVSFSGVSPAQGQDATFTPDGRFVLFPSVAALTSSSNSVSPNLYAWDRAQRTLQLVSQIDGHDLGFRRAFSVSGDSHFVAFIEYYAAATYGRDLIAGTNRLVRPIADWRSVSICLNGSGTHMVFTDYFSPMTVLDLASGVESPVPDVGYYNLLNGLRFSADGRFVVYARRSYAGENPVYHYAFNVFARDRLRETTTLLSSRATATDSNAAAWLPQLSADGRTVVFHSLVSDLAPNDFNDKLDLFTVKLAVDSDGDGMEDDWEVAYFGNLSRDGSGDFDHDGASDLQEFRTWTDPTNLNSILRVLRVSPVYSGARLLFWTGNSNLSHRVEFKDDLSAPSWMALPRTNVWDGSTASIWDTTASNSTHRYYRVVRLP